MWSRDAQGSLRKPSSLLPFTHWTQGPQPGTHVTLGGLLCLPLFWLFSYACWFLFPSLLLLLILFYSSEKGRRYTSQSLSSSCSQTDSGDALLLRWCQGRRGGKRFAAHRISYSQHQEVTAANRLVSTHPLAAHVLFSKADC